jgi:S-adenosylmethionine:tRNA ribosyltransferase-isomerase
VKTSDFDYDLPPELIAQAPLPERSASRMLVVPAGDAAFVDRHVRDLPELLQPGDLLVFNDTRVFPARLFGHKASGEAEVLARLEHGFWQLRFHVGAPLQDWLQHAGRLPLPPYIQREPGAEDAQRYQTVFARNVGAVAAPTAGLHFDEALLDALRARGVAFGHVTQHVGAGTFQPVRVDDVARHRMHSEWIEVGATLVEQVRRTSAAGGRVVAVGTTVVRALESAMQRDEAGTATLQPYSGDTSIFIYPGYRIRSVDALLTNFHLPQSTLLMLVSALSGKQRVLDAYAHAVASRYRFFSYGDAMLLFPAQVDAG